MKKLFFLFFVLLLLVPLSSAAPASLPQNDFDVAGFLNIVHPEKTTYKVSEEIIMRAYVFNQSQQLTGSDANCSFRMWNNTNGLVVNVSLSASGDAYLTVLNSSVMSVIGKYDALYFCNSVAQQGFAKHPFEITIDGLGKDSNVPAGLLAVISLLPILFGFLLLFWAASLDSESHSVFKIALGLLSVLMFIVSLQFSLLSVIKLHYFPAMQDAIGSTVFWLSWVFVVFIFYWFIYIIQQALATAAGKKIERLKY